MQSHTLLTTEMVSKDENGFSEEDKAELNTVLEDVDQGKNLEWPFNSAEEFISSLKASFIENKIMNTKITQRRSGK